jgi:peptide/nickel transport system ATP-binding protein
MTDHSTLPLLTVDDLSVEFRTRDGTVHAIDHVSFDIAPGETLALVGESGSGKSVTSFAIMGILDPAARITSGRVLFRGEDLLHRKERELRDIRGRDIAMIFQNPRTALNPIRTVGAQVADVLKRHSAAGADAHRRAIEALAQVKIADPTRRAQSYPFELSGGMCQRIMIAMALSCRPALLIADEPTTGLDVTIQAIIMDLIDEIARAQGMSTLLHAGHIVEVAPTVELLTSPRHPYTARLVAATPAPDVSLSDLVSIPGSLPDLRRNDLPTCRYSGRCERHHHDCDGVLPVTKVTQQHQVACRYPL